MPSAKWLFALLWLFISSALIVAAFETYDDKDRDAEESIQYEEDEHEHEQDETTTITNRNYSQEETTVQNSDKYIETSSEKEVIDENDDPLQKILPKVKFNCKGKSEGYYADRDFCQLFHYCKMNGFRFTFICPPKSYYNEVIMSCEFNATFDCVNSGKQTIAEHNSTSIFTEDIHASAAENVEIFEPNPMTTSTASYTTADPYLKKWRTPYGTRIGHNEITHNINNNSLKFNEQPNEDNISGLNLNTDTKVHSLETKNWVPFNGFSKLNRSQKGSDNQTNQNLKTIIKFNSIQNNSNEIPLRLLNNSANLSDKTSSTFRTNVNLVVKESQSNPSTNLLNHRLSFTTTTTQIPILVKPTTVNYDSTNFSSEPPLHLKNETQYKPNLFNYTKNFWNPEEKNIKQKYQNPSYNQNLNRPQSEPIRFSQLLSETPERPKTYNNNLFGLPRPRTETKSTQNSEFSSYLPRDIIGQDFPGFNLFNEQTFFNNQFENQRNKELDNSKIPTQNNFSNIRLQTSSSSPKKSTQSLTPLSEMIEVLTRLQNQQMKAENVAPKEINKSSNSANGYNKSGQSSVLSIPLLVPTGLSKNDLKRSISASLLKPTTIPLTESGREIPAYVLHLRNSKSKHVNTRSKRQTFGYTNGYLENPFLSNSQYLPMVSAIADNNYDILGNGLSFSPYNSPTPVGNSYEKPVLRPNPSIHPSAQQNFPYFLPPKQPQTNGPPNNPIVPNFDANIYDLNQFADFPIMQNIQYNEKPMQFNGKPMQFNEKPMQFNGKPMQFNEKPMQFNERPMQFNERPMQFNERPMQFIQSPPNNLVPYREVSLRRPSFKRPPRRQKIPENLSNENKTNLQTTQANKVENFVETKGNPSTPSSVSTSLRPTNPSNPSEFSFNINPFSQISNANIGNIGNIGEAIKLFDSSDDQYLPLDPSIFDSQSLFQFNSPKSQSNFIAQQINTNNEENGQPMASALTGRQAKKNVYSQPEIPYNGNKYLLRPFPPIPQFGDPKFRLPNVDIPDPTLRNVVLPQGIDNNQNFIVNDVAQQQNRAKNNQTLANVNDKIERPSSLRPFNFYEPEILHNINENKENRNQTKLNPNHNYDKDKDGLQTTRTNDITRRLEPLHDSRSDWNGIISRYNKPNITITKSVSYSTKSEDNKNSQINESSKENSVNQRPLPYGVRIIGSENKSPIISVKSSVRSVSSIIPESSNQIIVSKKSGSVISSNGDNDNDKYDKNTDLLDNLKVNANSDRTILLNYYNDLNEQKQINKYNQDLQSYILSKHNNTTETTTSISATTLKPPLTTHWSIRGWTGYPDYSTTKTPLTTLSPNSDFALFESEAIEYEKTSESPQTTTLRAESAYNKVFNSFQGANFQSNKKDKSQLFTVKSRPDLKVYLSSLASTPKSI